MNLSGARNWKDILSAHLFMYGLNITLAKWTFQNLNDNNFTYQTFWKDLIKLMKPP